MHILQEEIGLPVLTKSLVNDGDDTHVIFSIGPLPQGYGMTLGNSLRRVLLSSLPGAAVHSMRITGVQHEYTTIKGVTESVVDIMLNIKQLRIRKYSKDPEVMTLKVKGPKQVTAKDIDASSDIEILNPDLHLFTVEKGASIEIELNVDKGVGYSTANSRNKKQNEPGLIHIDAIYSPVEQVRYEVGATRVGQNTDLEKLAVDVKTNGSLSAEEAMQFASQLLKSYFEYFSTTEKLVESEFIADFSRVTAKSSPEADKAGAKESYTPIEILNFSPRTLNALINAGVGSIEQLTKCTESALSNFRGFGAKALDEVKDTLAERGLSLSDDTHDMLM
jgi:DNA-directed RNA polymerase subunit alpha